MRSVPAEATYVCDCALGSRGCRFVRGRPPVHRIGRQQQGQEVEAEHDQKFKLAKACTVHMKNHETAKSSRIDSNADAEDAANYVQGDVMQRLLQARDFSKKAGLCDAWLAEAMG